MTRFELMKNLSQKLNSKFEARAAVQIGGLKGYLLGFAWKGAETFMQISVKNMYLVSRDLVKSKIFGRDISDV